MSGVEKHSLASLAIHVGITELHGEDFGGLQRDSTLWQSNHQENAHFCGRYAVFQTS